jgi:hypothetical protein
MRSHKRCSTRSSIGLGDSRRRAGSRGTAAITPTKDNCRRDAGFAARVFGYHLINESQNLLFSRRSSCNRRLVPKALQGPSLNRSTAYLGAQPALDRCYLSRTGDHLSTVSRHECDKAGHRVEATQGYVP